MIRGKKINSNKRVYLDAQGQIVGGIHLDESQSYILIGWENQQRINISYQLKKDVRDYNQQYITRKMRALFLTEYKQIKKQDEKERLRNEAKERRKIHNENKIQLNRIDKITEELNNIRAPLGIIESAEEVSKRADELIEMCAPLEGYCWRNL